MPSRLTYPGIYIEELSSGVRTITGVATSIACFVGWAPKGPTDRAVRISSFTEYVRTFGEIHPKSYLGYAVKHFFSNGGSDAYVLRVESGSPANNKAATCTAGGIEFKASSSGDWANKYGIRVLTNSDATKGFSIEICEYLTDPNGKVDREKYLVIERFTNLSAIPNSPRFVKEIINDQYSGSKLVQVLTIDENVIATGFVRLEKGEASAPANINLLDWLTLKIDDLKIKLDGIDLFNLLCVPGLTDETDLQKLANYCENRRAILLVDLDNSNPATDPVVPNVAIRKNAAAYYPWLLAPDDLSEGRLADFPTCGFVAGLIARTDANRGVWKAPAGTEATLVGVHSPVINLTDQKNGEHNIKGINCIRNFPIYGNVVWGARTLDGDDEIGSEWKYIPVRRTALFIEETLYRSTKWVIFEPNDEPLWAQIRLNIGAFMNDLFRQGAFQGRSPSEAYFVKCDSETTTQSDINRGIVNVVVGFAPLKPAEFVVIKLTQITGQIDA